MPAASTRQQRAFSRGSSLSRRNQDGSSTRQRSGLAPRLGGTVALVLFGLILAAFVVQSAITQHIQGTLAFREPYLLFFIAHSTFTIIFPMHLLVVAGFDSVAISHYLYLLKDTLRSHFADTASTHNAPAPFPTRRLAIVVLLLTIGIALPGLLWYLAVSLASISSVTAIWNTNAFWAYLLTVWILEGDTNISSNPAINESSTLNPVVRTIGGPKWWRRLEPAKLAAVGIACVGVVVVVYSGGQEDTDEDPSNSAPTAPLAGILLTLLASLLYALVQVLYKKYISLPQQPSDAAILESSPLVAYRRLSAGDEHVPEEEVDGHSLDGETVGGDDTGVDSAVTSPGGGPAASLPFGLYANFITSLVGLGTLLLLWPLLLIPTPQASPQIPSSGSGPALILSILILAMSGLVFNTTYLILLSIWGPVLISVGNLLTIVLMLLVEVTVMDAPLPNLKAVVGCGMIAGGFAVLLWSMKVHGG